MNVEIGAEAALFPEKEYISRIFVAVYGIQYLPNDHSHLPVSELVLFAKELKAKVASHQ
jgi:hypothetical protein